MTGKGTEKEQSMEKKVCYLCTTEWWMYLFAMVPHGYYNRILSTFLDMYILRHKLLRKVIFPLFYLYWHCICQSLQWPNRLTSKHRMQQPFFLLLDSKREDRDTTLLNQHSATAFLNFRCLLSMHFQHWQAHFSSLCWMISIYENEHVRYTFFCTWAHLSGDEIIQCN